MVSHADILASNALLNDATTPRIAVFAGGTSGIGKLTLRALVATGASVRIYLIGRRSSFESANKFINELHVLNPRATVVWTEGEYSLLAETKRVCEEIKRKESRVDLLFLTAGYAPMGSRVETSEGIEVAQSLEYYSRVLFILHLLPLLRAAEAPRVVSVLSGGLERVSAINQEDLDLRKPGNFSGIKAQPQYGSMNTVALDKLAHDNPDVTFIHSWPGWVSTGNVNRGVDPNSLWAWFVWLFLGPLIRLVSISDSVSGQRNLFQSTSAAYGGRGIPWMGEPGVNTKGEQGNNGLFLVNFRCNWTPNLKVMALIRQKTQEKVWGHTQEMVKPYL
ncbi:hypothetical protein B0T25DRAFT_537050 [Lasiosphaeria hispida]|uniref:NAD(P)-binding protein n=1 Tax=Lasiosphaeria hispida TaxID=260671 RepID=A0AAJ0MFC6_9PEZI|nr:hypothetical protein B0T25DRAFT_537050 [Lasiosphaeria hispida]